MDEINKGIFNDLRQYIQNKGFGLDEISESSLRGMIRENFWIHLFYDWKYYEYVLNIHLDGYQHINYFFDFDNDVIFVREIYSRTNEIENKPIRFKNIEELLNHIRNNTDLKI